jgi:hypothetical protein
MAVTDKDVFTRWTDLQPVLDWELVHMTEQYRAPLVLYYLAGKSLPQAAYELGISHEALSRRLRRGIKILCKRLARCRVAVSAPLLITLLRGSACARLVPKVLATAVLQTASRRRLSPGVAIPRRSVFGTDGSDKQARHLFAFERAITLGTQENN